MNFSLKVSNVNRTVDAYIYFFSIFFSNCNYESKNSEIFVATRNSTIDFIFCIDRGTYKIVVFVSLSKLAKIRKIMYVPI